MQTLALWMAAWSLLGTGPGSEPGPTTPLRGTVLEPDGTPAAGALVVLAGLPDRTGLPTLARGTADHDGRFTLERPAAAAGEGRYRALRLWAVRPGRRAASAAYPGRLPGAKEPVVLRLGNPAGAEVHVTLPDGGPAPGVAVRPLRLRREFAGVPVPVAEAAQAMTDARGVARLDAFGTDELAGVELRSEALGVQPRDEDLPVRGPWVFLLRPVGRVEVRFAADDPADVAGWDVSASTRPAELAGYHQPIGTALAKLDGQGRCTIPVLAAGTLDLYVEWPGTGRVLPVWSRLPPVRAGETTRVEIPVKRAATVAGQVRERGTGKPVPGVRVYLFRAGENSSSGEPTDADGRFAALSFAGKARVSISEVPDGYVRPADLGLDNVVVPEPPGRVDLPPVELARAAPPLKGVVRDEAGKPVARALVRAYWTANEGGKSYSGRVDNVRCDADGSFELKGLAPGASVSLDAQRHGLATTEPARAVAGQDRPATVVLRPVDAMALAGRVVGPGGEPVEDAVVSFQYRQEKQGAAMNFRQYDRFDDEELRTGPDGRFRTPREILRESALVQAHVRAPGLLPVRSAWLPGESAVDGVLTFPAMVLRRPERAHAVAGRVVDRSGAPVEGVLVFQSGDGPKRTEARSDAAGRFRLEGVYEGPALVFAEKAGFRFGGAVVPPKGDAEIRLARPGEVAVALPEAGPHALRRVGERAMARRLLEPLVGQARDDGGGPGTQTYDVLARVDPERVLTMVENRVLTGLSGLTRQAALGQYEDDPAAAVATLEADRDPAARASGFLALTDLAAALGRPAEAREELLARALAETRRETDTTSRLRHLAALADLRLDAGRVDLAAPLLREGQALMKDPAPDRSPWETDTFAEILAAIDLPAARAILERRDRPGTPRLTPADLQRHLAAAARRVARTDPAVAETLVTGLGTEVHDRTALLLQACRAMAPKDLARARRLLGLLADYGQFGVAPSPSLPLYGLATLSSAVETTDPAAARRLLDEAVDGLIAAGRDGRQRECYPPLSLVLAGVLPLAGRLEPERVDELAWRAASLRMPRYENPSGPAFGSDAHQAVNLAALAVLTDPFDREVARVVAAPVLDRIDEMAVESNYWGVNVSDLLRLLASYDPAAFERRLAGLPPTARRPPSAGAGPALDTRARLETARLLSLPPALRTGEALGSLFTPWAALP